MQWDSWNCLYGWPVQGIWPTYSERVEEGKPDPTSVDRSLDQKLMAVSNEKGGVRVYNFPTIDKQAAFLEDEKPTHVGPVSSARFSADGRFVVSVGREDRSIVVWRVQRVEEEEKEAESLVKEKHRRIALDSVAIVNTVLSPRYRQDEEEEEKKEEL
jgi:WD40 repeat protein